MTTATPATAPLTVQLGTRSYAIEIVDGPVAKPAAHEAYWSRLLGSLDGPDIALVSNTTLMPRYGEPLGDVLRGIARRVVPVAVADGESYKTSAMLDTIHDAMLEARLDRRSVVVALGGGVVGDVAGFAAATYQRGVRFIQLPTTLLAQVDSSVGGKTGINHRLGKNMIGAFHQPSAVVIDLSTLRTLPPREFAAGLAEVIKYGVALDAAFFEWLDAEMPALLARDPIALAHAIRRSCEIKAMIVGSDERESAERALLNFGHTFGHAIEGATGYGTWLHGEAVAAGMVLASRLSEALGTIDGDVTTRLRALLARAGLPVEAPSLDETEWLRWMSGDKKADAGRLRFVVLDALGRSRVATVPDETLSTVLREPHPA